MKSLSPARLAYRQARAAVVARGLLWLTGRNRVTRLPESMGLWTGDDHEVFSIGGEARTFFGAGSCLDLGNNVSRVGLDIASRTVLLSALSPEVRQATLGYDVRLARAEIYRAEFDAETNNLIDVPERTFKGWVDKAVWSRGVKDGKAQVALTLVPTTRALTRTLALKFSDASQRLVDPADGFFKYADLSGSASVWWGEKRVDSYGAAPSKFIRWANSLRPNT